MLPETAKKIFRFSAVFALIAIFSFSNLAPMMLNNFGAKKLAESLKIKSARAETVVYSVPWLSGLEGFTWVSESCTGTCAQDFTAADGNPAGSAYVNVSLRNKQNTGYWMKQMTWEQMGVPAGANVTDVDGSFDVKLAQETHAAVQAVGLKLFNFDNSTSIATGGVDIETEFDPTNAGWATRNVDGAKNIGGSYRPSDTLVTIRMRESVNSGNNASAASEVRVDNIIFNITYTSAPSGPNATSFANNTEGTLTDGARTSQSITITGTNFGSGPCDGVANAVKIGAYALSCSGSIWSNTSITIGVDSGINVFGGTGASGLIVRAGGVDDSTPLNFYVYPNITSVAVPGGNPADSARELENIDLNGTRFDSNANQGTIDFVGGFGAVSATIVSWSDTLVTVAVPAAIADNVYLGDIRLTRSAATNSKTDLAYGSNTFRILPKINSLDPNTGAVNDTVIIIGNHLCQSGTCPSAGSRSTASNNVTFYNGVQVPDADVTSWTHGDSSTAGITVKAPAGAQTGDVVVRSNTDYISNGVTFSFASAVPNDPTDLYQFKTNNDISDSPPDHIPWTNENPDGKLPAGGGFNQADVWLRSTATAGVNTTLCIQVEVKDSASAFDGIGTVTGVSPDGCKSFSVGAPVKLFVQVTGLSNNTNYKWRARIKNNSTGDYGNWINASVDGNGKSFYVDTSAPSSLGSCPFHSSVNAGGATVSWSGTDNMSTTFTKQAQYSTVADFSSFLCSPGATCGTPASGLNSNPQTVSITNLSPNMNYYYRVRSKDGAGNEKITGYGLNGDTSCAFTTSQGETKTSEFYVASRPTLLNSGSEYAPSFNVFIPESGYAIKSAFVEFSGIFSLDSDSSSVVAVRVNSQPGVDYTVNTSNITVSPFYIIHEIPVDYLNVSTPSNPNNSNIFGVTVNEPGMSIAIASAKIVITYYHTPVQ